MCNQNVRILFFVFLFWTTVSYSQKEQLIIGRTTGTLSISPKKNIRTFGFTHSLSGPVTLPGHTITAKVGDSIHIDFWNISQGNPVSLYCKEINFIQRNRDREILSKKEPVHHMEHGYYSFVATKPGTYLYYSPENYPFHLQAGMFGLIIITPENTDAVADTSFPELRWCSHEIDTKWHTNMLMGTEYDPTNQPIPIPKYVPEYFCINGQKASNIKGVISKKDTSKTILLRLANAGLYTHTIQFPVKVILEIKNHNINDISNKIQQNKITIASGETIEIVVNLEATTPKETITYQFIEPTTQKEYATTTIPIWYP